VHGANRLASNSLLEGLVFGRRTGLYLRDHPDLLRSPVSPAAGPAGGESPLAVEGSAEVAAIRVVMRQVMWEDVGILRTGESLDRAAGRLEDWRNQVAGEYSLPAWELGGMLLAALGIATAARERKGSRGGHYRLDHPDRGPYGNRHVELRLGPSGRPEAFWIE
jgi:L-aspartate oxidase